jgi:hypothetical protein
MSTLCPSHGTFAIREIARKPHEIDVLRCFDVLALLPVVNETMLGGRSIISWSRSTTAQSTFYFIADFESPTNQLGRLYALKGSGPFVLEDVGLDVLHNTIHTYANAGSEYVFSKLSVFSDLRNFILTV